MALSDDPAGTAGSPQERLTVLLEGQERGDLDVDDADELGRLLFETGELAASVKIFAAAVERHPDELWLRLNYAKALRAAGDDARAAEMYERAGVEGGDVEDLESAADLFLELEDWAALERVASAGLALSPDHGSFLLLRANALDDLGRHGEAEAGYQRAMDLAPDDPDVLFNFGLFLKRRERHADAVAVLSRATEIDPDLAIAWANRPVEGPGSGRR